MVLLIARTKIGGRGRPVQVGQAKSERLEMEPKYLLCRKSSAFLLLEQQTHRGHVEHPIRR
jgi:hypothetical protein